MSASPTTQGPGRRWMGCCWGYHEAGQLQLWRLRRHRMGAAEGRELHRMLANLEAATPAVNLDGIKSGRWSKRPQAPSVGSSQRRLSKWRSPIEPRTGMCGIDLPRPARRQAGRADRSGGREGPGRHRAGSIKKRQARPERRIKKSRSIFPPRQWTTLWITRRASRRSRAQLGFHCNAHRKSRTE